MFDLEQSIAEWRRQMLSAGIQSPATLDELENHLREEIARRQQSGLGDQPAYAAAIRQIGQAAVLKTEFSKVGETVYGRLKQSFRALAGIPNHQLITNMNTSPSNMEPRWAIYTKAGIRLFPAVFVWLSAVIFVLPKANEICTVAGTTVFNFAHPVPAILQVWMILSETLFFLTNHIFFTVGLTALLFTALERYFNQWPQYRRAAIGVGSFLLNAVILLSLLLMIVSVLVAAPALVHHIK